MKNLISNPWGFKKNRLSSLLSLYVIWPLMSLILAFKQFRFKESRFIFILFAFLLGYSFDFSDIAADGSRYALWFIEYGNKNFSDFIRDIVNLGQYGNTDIYTTCSYFLVSRFTDNPHILFSIWAGIYFFFFVKCIGVIIDYINDKKYSFNISATVFFLGLVLLMPLNAINGVRMWTAFVVFFYAAIKIVIKNDKRYLFVAAIAIFIHFSYLFALFFLLFYYLFRNKPAVLYFLLFCSLIGSTVFSSYIVPYIGSLGEGIDTKVQGYLNEEYIANRGEAISAQIWYAAFKQPILQYFLYLALGVAYFVMRKRNADKILWQSFYFAIVMWSMFNFSSVSAVQGRYFYFFAFSVLLFLTLISLELRFCSKIKPIAYLGLLPLCLWVGVGQLNAMHSFDSVMLLYSIFTIPLYFIFP